MIGFHPPTHAPERVSLTCPLGLRFLDLATGGFVSDGLRATAWPAGTSQSRIKPVVTSGGVFAFHGLPGLRRFENSSADDPWTPLPVTHNFQVEVVDEFGRFLPCTFAILAPAKGLATFADDGSPPWIEAGAVPLFSAAGRPVPGAVAVVRAELRTTAQQPAAWALVEATYFAGGELRTTRGLADAKGRMVLFFPYPEGQRRGFEGSPPSGARGISQQEWTLRMSFFHEEVNHEEVKEPEETANYALRLTQPRVQAWRGVSPLTPLSEVTLTFGRELDLNFVDLGSA